MIEFDKVLMNKSDVFCLTKRRYLYFGNDFLDIFTSDGTLMQLRLSAKSKQLDQVG